MFINSVNLFKNYNTGISMRRRSSSETLETPEAIANAVSKLKNLTNTEEKCKLLSKITTAAYNLLKIKQISINGEDLVDEMLNAVSFCTGNQKVFRYFALVHSFARVTGCLNEKEQAIAKKAKECGFDNYSSSFSDSKTTQNGQKLYYSDIFYEGYFGKPKEFRLNNTYGETES